MNYYFLSFEILMITLFILCFLHARKAGMLHISKLVAGLLFGLLLEWATIQQLHSYYYGKFPIMLGEVPVAIGIGWAVIIYSSGLLTDSTNVKPWMRSVLDAMLALNIDLSMDLIAIRLGMWNWGITFDSQFFGVKWGNFWAWFWVVFFFSLAFRYMSERRSKLLRGLSPVAAIVIGTMGVLATNYLIARIVPDAVYHIVVISFLAMVLAVTLLQRPAVIVTDVHICTLAVPTCFHVYFITAGFISGTITKPIFVLLVSVSMLIVSFIIHRKLLGIFKRAA